MMPNSVPVVCRHVHYVSYGTPGGEYRQACRAAIVTDVGAWLDVETRDLDDTPMRRRVVVQQWDDMAVALHVLNPTGTFLNTGIRHDAGVRAGGVYEEYRYDSISPLCTGLAHDGGTWHWPVHA